MTFNAATAVPLAGSEIRKQVPVVTGGGLLYTQVAAMQLLLLDPQADAHALAVV
jgi:hypothetical protein